MPLSVTLNPDSVSPVQGGGYVVPSKGTPGAYRLVWGNECSCPHTGPRPCRHRRLVAAYCQAIDAASRKARRPVNVSLLVD